MSFEFELVPREGAFGPADLDAMRDWWARFPTAAAADGTLLVFADEEARELALARLALRPGRNDYLIPQVSFAPAEVQLSIVGDRVTDRRFHDFALWVQEKWAAELQYFGEVVPAEDLLAAAGDD